MTLRVSGSYTGDYLWEWRTWRDGTNRRIPEISDLLGARPNDRDAERTIKPVHWIWETRNWRSRHLTQVTILTTLLITGLITCSGSCDVTYFILMLYWRSGKEDDTDTPHPPPRPRPLVPTGTRKKGERGEILVGNIPSLRIKIMKDTNWQLQRS